VTAVFPYVVLIVLFFRGVTLEGAGKGVAFLFTPDVRVISLPASLISLPQACISMFIYLHCICLCQGCTLSHA
jgi:SNF family Na+-dependent transporter